MAPSQPPYQNPYSSQEYSEEFPPTSQPFSSSALFSDPYNPMSYGATAGGFTSAPDQPWASLNATHSPDHYGGPPRLSPPSESTLHSGPSSVVPSPTFPPHIHPMGQQPITTTGWPLSHLGPSTSNDHVPFFSSQADEIDKSFISESFPFHDSPAKQHGNPVGTLPPFQSLLHSPSIPTGILDAIRSPITPRTLPSSSPRLSEYSPQHQFKTPALPSSVSRRNSSLSGIHYPNPPRAVHGSIPSHSVTSQSNSASSKSASSHDCRSPFALWFSLQPQVKILANLVCSRSFISPHVQLQCPHHAR